MLFESGARVVEPVIVVKLVGGGENAHHEGRLRTVCHGYSDRRRSPGPSARAPTACPRDTLHQPLVQHRIRDFQKAADVGAIHQVSRSTISFGGFVTRLVDGDHDLV